jgi:hypothetical protein
MIAYDLQCIRGHHFEGWFEDEGAYLKQEQKKMIACPVCHSANVTRIPSTFAIKSSHPEPPVSKAYKDQMTRLGRQIVQFVEQNFDNVGADFAKEALKMHYGVTEPRNIRGSSSQEEEKILKAEGIQFYKFPMPAPPETEETE